MAGTCCSAAETARATSACMVPAGLSGQVAPGVAGLHEMCSRACCSHGGSVALALEFPGPQTLAAKSARPSGSTGGKCSFLYILCRPCIGSRWPLPASDAHCNNNDSMT